MVNSVEETESDYQNNLALYTNSKESTNEIQLQVTPSTSPGPQSMVQPIYRKMQVTNIRSTEVSQSCGKAI